ncbi:hypothetical protein ACW7EJ_00155, partial [Acinetobacter soli]
ITNTCFMFLVLHYRTGSLEIHIKHLNRVKQLHYRTGSLENLILTYIGVDITGMFISYLCGSEVPSVLAT